MDDQLNAARARDLLADEWFTGEMQRMSQMLLQRISQSEPHEVEEREQAYMQLKAHQAILAHFEGIAASEQIARKRWRIL